MAEREGFTVIDYQVMMPDTFPPLTDEISALRRECRGIKFGTDGKILARPFHKFFNLNAELLAANKRIVNLGLELMGARTLQRLAAENDARGHQARSARRFVDTVRDKGLKEAFRERDSAFGDGRARVEGPEIRDEHGRLID